MKRALKIIFGFILSFIFVMSINATSNNTSLKDLKDSLYFYFNESFEEEPKDSLALLDIAINRQ